MLLENAVQVAFSFHSCENNFLFNNHWKMIQEKKKQNKKKTIQGIFQKEKEKDKTSQNIL